MRRFPLRLGACGVDLLEAPKLERGEQQRAAHQQQAKVHAACRKHLRTSHVKLEDYKSQINLQLLLSGTLQCSSFETQRNTIAQDL